MRANSGLSGACISNRRSHAALVFSKKLTLSFITLQSCKKVCTFYVPVLKQICQLHLGFCFELACLLQTQNAVPSQFLVLVPAA